MVCQDTISSFKINKNKNIGKVVIIVEGAVDEMRLFKRIFNDVLGYVFYEKRRTQEKFKVYDEFVKSDNDNSRVAVINAKNSNISTLTKDFDYLNEVYKILYTEYGIDIKYARVYFVWDRDRDSNTDIENIKYLLENLSNSLDNDNGDMHGLLLLSYPNIETYLVSSFGVKYSEKNVKNLKEFVKMKQISIHNIEKANLKKGVVQMHKALKSFNIREYNLDKMARVNLKIFDGEEEYYDKFGYYKWLSLVSIILLDLGIIGEK